ncbi:hypothetical protein H9P43_003573 [Blastocladiella emersonii ATCC 22665]|nr:hypothetical protein H9P43_003573 [Blastocladiella emersonii ATCC 22665]
MNAAAPPAVPPTTRRRSLAMSLHTFARSLLRSIVWLLTAMCVFLTALDLYVQALDRPPTSSIFLQLFIIGSYALLALASLIFAFSRFMTVRGALARLPKLYVPITQADGLPDHVHAHIAAKLDASARLIANAKPAVPPADVQWGAPGTPLDGTQFRAATVASAGVLARALAPWVPSAAADPATPVRTWLRAAVDASLVDKRLAKLYLDAYHAARWGCAPQSQDAYLHVMKLLAVILQRIPVPDEDARAPAVLVA